MKSTSALLVIWIGVVALAQPASAQDLDPFDVAKQAIARACDAHEGQAILPKRLAEAISFVTSTGLPEDDALRTLADPDSIAARTRHRIILISATKRVLLTELSRKDTALAKALQVTSGLPAGEVTSIDWLFGSGASPVLICAKAKPALDPKFTALPLIALRKTAAELAKLGSERTAAGSAQITYDDLRTTNLAGEAQRTQKLIVNAAAGVALAGDEDRYAIAYAEYSRSRTRLRSTSAAADPAKNGSADDIDALEVGILGTARIRDLLRVTGRGGFIIDSVTHARFASGTLSFTPITGGRPSLGFCNLNSFRSIGLGMEALCTATVEGDVRYVLKRGNATIGAKDMIVAAGPSVGISLRRSLDGTGKPQNGLVGSVSYRYLPVLAGTAPDIDRVDVSLAYRIWADKLGFDLGLTYADGIERKALADEHRFGATFGVIF